MTLNVWMLFCRIASGAGLNVRKEPAQCQKKEVTMAVLIFEVEGFNVEFVTHRLGQNDV